jgi:ATP-binding cassette subfamily A (ABC1) protein 3
MIMVYLASGVVMVITCFALYQIPKTRDINDKYVRHVFRLFPNFCLSDTVFFLSARDLLRKGQWDWFISGYDLVYMGAETIVYFALTLVLERFAAVKSIADMCSEDPVLPDPIDMEDDDVKAERQRVHHCDDLIQLRDIRKTFESPPSVAVKSLSFGVQRNQCFGFLGVNGTVCIDFRFVFVFGIGLRTYY